MTVSKCVRSSIILTKRRSTGTILCREPNHPAMQLTAAPTPSTFHSQRGWRLPCSVSSRRKLDYGTSRLLDRFSLGGVETDLRHLQHGLRGVKEMDPSELNFGLANSSRLLGEE